MVVSSLMKLAGGSPALAGELNVDAFLRQVLPVPLLRTAPHSETHLVCYSTCVMR